MNWLNLFKIHVKDQKEKIHYCYPLSDELNNYSVLDFSHGTELYEIGKNNFTCEEYNYC